MWTFTANVVTKLSGFDEYRVKWKGPVKEANMLCGEDYCKKQPLLSSTGHKTKKAALAAFLFVN